MLDLWPEDLARRLQELPLEEGSVAAFDADETLWHTDAGIEFLRWCSENKVLPGEDGGAGAFDEYREIRSRDEAEGLMACARPFVGLELERLKELSHQFFTENVEPVVYPAQRQLFDWLHEKGVRVFVVTASFEHAVIPGAAALGVPAERVIGIRLEVKDGVVRDLRLGPITFREHKARELFERAGSPPVLAMGNGSNDRELLESATHLAVAINPSTTQRRDGTVSLARRASELGWPVLALGDPRK